MTVLSGPPDDRPVTDADLEMWRGQCLMELGIVEADEAVRGVGPERRPRHIPGNILRGPTPRDRAEERLRLIEAEIDRRARLRPSP